MNDDGMCEHETTEGVQDEVRCDSVVIPQDVYDRLQLAADGSTLSKNEMAQRYLRYGKKHHENAVYGDEA